jgi:hypothetical protein
MTEAQFLEEQRWLGWRAQATNAFGLRPAEAHALGLLVRNPGRPVAISTLAAYEGDLPEMARHFNGSHPGVLRRLSRLRQKLDDLGCCGAVELVGHEPGRNGSAATGVLMPAASARRVDTALRCALGVISAVSDLAA